jgi:hypothetical protein
MDRPYTLWMHIAKYLILHKQQDIKQSIKLLLKKQRYINMSDLLPILPSTTKLKEIKEFLSLGV